MNDFYDGFMNRVLGQKFIVYVIIGIAVSLLVLLLPLPYIVALACGSVVLVLTAAKPEIGILIIVILTSSIVFEDKLPLIPIGVGSFHLPDILLLYMFGLLFYKWYSHNDFVFAKSKLNIPLILFFLSVLAWIPMSIIFYKIDFNTVFRILRTFSYYLIFFLITNLVTEKSQLRFMIKGLYAIAAVVSLMMLVQTMIGDSVQLMPGRVEAAATFSEEFGTLRILPPGQTLMYALFITGFCSFIFMQNKSLLGSGYFYLTALLGAGVVITYNRSYWVAILLTVGLLLILTASENRMRLIGLLMALAIFVISFTAVLGSSGGTFGETVNAVSDRFTSLFTGKKLIQSSSLEDRYVENSYAIDKIKRHPLVGIGLGNEYRPNLYGPQDKLQYYVHNAYLWLIMDMGLIGFLLFFWYYFTFLARGFKYWKNMNDGFLKSAVIGFTLAGVGLLVIAVVNPVFFQWYSVVVISIGIGISEVAIRIDYNDPDTFCSDLLDSNG